jgi:hypothetical protein
MKLDELQREVESLTREEQRKLIAFLVGLEVRHDEAYRSELTRRLDDKDPSSWISLKEAEYRLKGDEV